MLASASFLQLVSVPVWQTLNTLERLGTQLGWDAARLAATVAVLVWAGRSSQSPLAAVSWYSAVMTLAYGAQVWISQRALVSFERQHSEAGPR